MIFWLLFLGGLALMVIGIGCLIGEYLYRQLKAHIRTHK